MKATIEVEDCYECPYEKYVRCYGHTCMHPDCPHDGNELDRVECYDEIPEWCPIFPDAVGKFGGEE